MIFVLRFLLFDEINRVKSDRLARRFETFYYRTRIIAVESKLPSILYSNNYVHNIEVVIVSPARAIDTGNAHRTTEMIME